MSKKEPNLYEGMYVISAKLSDEARKKVYDQIVKEIEQRGGQLLKVHERGRQKLAYEIDGHREGYYYLLYFQLLPSHIADLWKEYELCEGLVRYLTLRTEKVMEKIEFKSLEE